MTDHPDLAIPLGRVMTIGRVRLNAGIKPSCNSLARPANALIPALQTATFCLMMTDGKDMDIDIKDLARAHAMAAIDVLAEIMTNPNAPAAARISAAKAILDRGFGKPTLEKTEPESREEQVVRIERVIIDPKEPHPERYRGYTHAANDQLPAEEDAGLDQQDQDQAQRAPPDAGESGDCKMTSYNEWG